MALLTVQHLSKSFPVETGLWRQTTGYVLAAKDVSFDVSPGETVALVGGSGCGKSTLAKMVAGLLIPDSGTISWEGQPMTGFSRRDWAHRVQMIFQDPYASLNPKLSIGTQLQEVMGTLTRPAGTLSQTGRGQSAKPCLLPEREKVAEGRMRASSDLMDSVGLSKEALPLYPFQFSGGQRQRIAIARALASQPKLLIADEPLSALDVSTQAQILELFESLQKSLGLSFLFITHDLGMAHRFADRVLVLQNGAVVEEGLSAEVLRHPAHPYTRALLDAVPSFSC